MSIEIKVPPLPESVADATLAAWHKKKGDFVNRDENIVDLETDKVVLEVPAPQSGILEDILFQVGDVVKAEQVLAKIRQGEKGEGSATSSDKGSDTEEIQSKSSSAKSASAKKEVFKTAAELENLSPSARRMVAEYDIDVSKVSGSGKGGRVTIDDIKAAISQSSTVSHAPVVSDTSPISDISSTSDISPVSDTSSTSDISSVPSPSVVSPASPTPRAPEISGGARTEERVPMSRLRARIAERLVEAQQTAAILTTFNEVNMKPVMDLRQKYKDVFEKKHGVRLGFMSFFTKAVVEALKRFPAVNASIDGKDVVYHGYQDVGIAVSSPRGLVVPILRDAQQLSLAEIEKQINIFGQKAKDGKLTVEEMTGGTFTISNGGVFGSLLSTPIINPPQSAILGMHKIEERPVVEQGEIVIRPMMYLALSYDHRIIDGKESVSFLVAIKDFLEDPARLLLDI